jgi:RNA-directed DNA polymerase
LSLKTPNKIRNLQRKLYLKAKAEPGFRFYLLYDKIYRKDILDHAFRVARANGGAPGLDGKTFGDVESDGLEEWLSGIRKELRAKTYKPQPVLRVYIPKAGGGRRPLGIPTIRDRVVQTACKLVTEPIFEADLESNAYGYRPGRSAQDAIRQVHQMLFQGFTEVVDADLSNYFETIPHGDLMKSIARRIVDRNVLRLIKMWLTVPVVEAGNDGKRHITGGKKTRRGTPQGGVVSPLLANVYMNRFLKYWRIRQCDDRYKARIVSYADDFVILSRGKAGKALEWTRQVMVRLGLTLNEGKTSIRDARREHFDFLGYSFGPHYFRKNGNLYMGASPSEKSVRRVKRRVRDILRPGNLGQWSQVRDQINRLLAGWSNYFSYGTRLMAYRAVDQYVYNSVCHFLTRRHKVPSRGTRIYPMERVHGEMGIISLRRLHIGAPPCARR